MKVLKRKKHTPTTNHICSLNVDLLNLICCAPRPQDPAAQRGSVACPRSPLGDGHPVSEWVWFCPAGFGFSVSWPVHCPRGFAGCPQGTPSFCCISPFPSWPGGQASSVLREVHEKPQQLHRQSAAWSRWLTPGHSADKPSPRTPGAGVGVSRRSGIV